MSTITYEMANIEPHPTAGDVVMTMSRRTGKPTGTRYLIHGSRRTYYLPGNRLRFRLTVERDDEHVTPGRFVFLMYWDRRHSNHRQP